MGIINDGLEPEHFQALVKYIAQGHLYAKEGIRLHRLGKGYAEFIIVGEKTLHNLRETVHSSAAMSCAAIAMSTAVLSSGYKPAMIEQNCSIMLPCPPQADILCIGEIVKSNDALFFCEANLYANHTQVASFHSIFSNLGSFRTVKG